MHTLLATEHFDFGCRELLRGWIAALRRRESGQTIEIPGFDRCVSARSARSAFVVALKALDLPRSARVGVPLYCCPVVFKAIEMAGCKPVFLDVDRETFCITPEDLSAKASRVDAVIAVHTFGNLCDIPRLQEVVPGKPILEDCAQAIGSKLGDRMAGSLGTVGVFSFRSGKYLSVGDGGALYVRDEKLRARIVEMISKLPVPSVSDELAHVVKTYLRSRLRSRPLYGMVGDPLWRIYNKKTDYAAKTPIAQSQIFKSDFANTRKRLTLLGPAIERQRDHARYFMDNLKVEAGMLSAEQTGVYSNRYLFPVTFPSVEHRDLMAAHLRSHRIGSIKNLDEIVEVARSHHDYGGDCPVAEQLSKRVLLIPVNYGLKRKHIAAIASAFNAGWARIGSRHGVASSEQAVIV